MKLGEMLIRDGRLSDEALHEALAIQARDGGRLGTILVEQGHIDLDALTVYLGLELGIPIATGATLERVKKSAVRTLTPAQAVKYKCVPIIIQDHQLTCATEDPHDFAMLDELNQITGYRILPRVAPEIRIYYYIERYYGAPRPARFRAFGDSPRGNAPQSPGLPAPPLPGLPPLTAAPVKAPTPVPELRMNVPEADEAELEALELEAEDLLEELESDHAAAADQAPKVPAQARPQPTVAAPSGDDGEVLEPEAPIEPIDEATAVAAIDAAIDRGAIADAILGYAASRLEVAVLFVVRDNMAFGWRAHGSSVERDRVECALLPLSVPSILQAALESDEGMFCGDVFPSTLHSYLANVLRCDEPARAVVGVVSIGKRVVNLVYGFGGDVDEISKGIRRVCDHAASGYVRLITAAKRSRRGSVGGHTPVTASAAKTAEPKDSSPTVPVASAATNAPTSDSAAQGAASTADTSKGGKSGKKKKRRR